MLSNLSHVIYLTSQEFKSNGAHLSHDQEQGVKLKLARLISIPERPELYSLVNRRNSGESIYAKKPPLPSPSPNRLVSNC